MGSDPQERAKLRIATLANQLVPRASGATPPGGLEREHTEAPRADRRLAGKIALVTGAASGIGRASALRFAAEGAKVLCADTNESDVRDTAQQIRNGGGIAEHIVCNVSNATQVEATVEQCVNNLGGLDIMFANAGVLGSLSPWTEIEAEEWAPVLQVNVVGVFNCFKFAALKMQQLRGEVPGGSLIATSSVAGIRSGQPNLRHHRSKIKRRK
ncbi:hypothetical protein CYMTET_51943 [Cymbomonas tetramitiformis]|uniref:Uncharacterized protein n=1 Tax=Cymbomonas tetramitiformis TaxID=36881 RepID=A0AAE0BK30_9CHLO|nr:hypothetical protein CYMTET_51943 [Cymbomonas tetramitiformis]